MEKVWVVASGKGGTGKSTVVANLGAALANEGHKVLLVDLDVGLRCLDFCLGMDDRVLFDVMDVLTGYCRAQDAILACPSIPSLYLMPAAQNRSAQSVDGLRLQAMCGSLTRDFDMIILDCPPGLDPIPTRAAMTAYRGLIVTTADPAAIRDADRMAAEFLAAGVPETYLVVNRFRADFLQKRISCSAQDIAASLGLPLLGTIPEDDSVGAATLCGVPVAVSHPESPAGRIFKAMAGRMPGKDLL